MFDILSAERIAYKKGFNRWYIPVASILIHLCIGSVYAWSIFNQSLTNVIGVVGSASNDWKLDNVVWVFSTAVLFVGIMTLLSSKWIEKAGPRKVGVYSSFLFFSGFVVSYFAIKTHQLWMLYLGYGVFGGLGIGLAYVSPVATLLRWFPDKRGLATGMAIMGFGGGAMVATPIKQFLSNLYYVAPENLGNVTNLALKTVDGINYTDVSGVMTEVIIKNGQAYVVGTGDVGVANTFLTMGVIYFIVMFCASFVFRLPPTGSMLKGFKKVDTDNVVSKGTVLVDSAMKTPQFYLLWLAFCLNTSAGMGVIAVAKTMIIEIFGTALPNIVDIKFAAFYVMMISVANMTGRIFWATLSDYIGRKNTFSIFFVFGLFLYLSVPYTASAIAINPAIKYLVMFYALTMLIFTMFGGGFSTLPAYVADLFGQNNMGAIYGRVFTAWAVSALVGPFVIIKLRKMSFEDSIYDLSSKIDGNKFIQKFGVGKDKIQSLIDNNVINIEKLMQIAPQGTVDPSVTLYNSTMYVMASLLILGFLINIFIRKVDSKYYEK